MAGKRKQRICRICKKRPPWKYKNCPPDVCKRCYHRHVWPERPWARKCAADDLPDGTVLSNDLFTLAEGSEFRRPW